MLSKINVFNYLSVVIVFMLSTIAFLYGEKVHSSFVRSDEWRFIDVYLVPLYEGVFSWKYLFMDQHSSSIDGILFIINALYFNLTGDLFFYVGIISKILILILLTLVIKKNFKNNSIFCLFALLLIGTTFFSLKATMEYQWPLVTRFSFFVLLFLMAFYFIDKIIQKNNNTVKYFIYIYLILIILLLAHKSGATIMISSAIALMVALLIFNKENRTKYVYLILLFFAAFLTIKLFWIIFSIEQSHSVNSKINFYNFSIMSFMESYVLALLSGFVKIEFLKKNLEISTLLFLGYTYGLIYFIVIFYSMKFKTYEKSTIPLILMFYPLLFILGVLLYRYFPVYGEVNWLVISPRYIKTYELGTVGLLWNILLIYDKVKLDRWKNNMLISLGFLFILINIYYMYFSYKTSNAFVKAFSNADEKFYYYAGDKDSLPKWLKGGHFSDEKVQFLKKNNLNIFNENYNFKEFNPHIKNKL